jgi:hypothetical protein
MGLRVQIRESIQDRNCIFKKKKKKEARRQWLMPVILATKEAEIRRIKVRGPDK